MQAEIYDSPHVRGALL